MGNAMPRQNDPQTRGAARSMGQAPADWFVDPAAPSTEPSAAEQLPGLEEQAEAFLAQADAATGTSPENLATTEQELDLHSSDPQILKLWQQAAGAYGVDEDEGELAWQADALCAQTDPEAFFPEKGGSTRDAKRVCAECPVSAQCLEYALAKDERFGIWGGLSERERRRMRKRAS